MGIPRIQNAIATRGNENGVGSYYHIADCPYCHEPHTHSYNCLNSYKVAKCSDNNEGYHYKIVLSS